MKRAADEQPLKRKDEKKPKRDITQYYSTEADDPELYAKIVGAAKHLKKHGWAVMEDLIDEKTIQRNTSKMWDTLEAMSAQYKKAGEHFSRECTNYAAVPMSRLLPHKHGIVESAHFNHCEAAREMRVHDIVLKVFATLYGTTQLVGSMDRINWKFPGKKYTSQAEWPHADRRSAPPTPRPTT